MLSLLLLLSYITELLLRLLSGTTALNKNFVQNTRPLITMNNDLTRTFLLRNWAQGEIIIKEHRPQNIVHIAGRFEHKQLRLRF